MLATGLKRTTATGPRSLGSTLSLDRTKFYRLYIKKDVKLNEETIERKLV
jgi:hypothetical protein